MTRRPPADADEDTLIMRRRPRVAAAGKQRPARRLGPVWLGLGLAAILLGGGTAWVFRSLEPPAATPSVAAAPQPAPPDPVAAPQVAAQSAPTQSAATQSAAA